MTDVEIYTYWFTNYEAINARVLRGELTDEACDRAIRNMEERLGVNTWSVERWAAAAEEGA